MRLKLQPSKEQKHKSLPPLPWLRSPSGRKLLIPHQETNTITMQPLGRPRGTCLRSYKRKQHLPLALLFRGNRVPLPHSSQHNRCTRHLPSLPNRCTRHPSRQHLPLHLHLHPHQRPLFGQPT